jgi:hypothetical protein
MFLPTTLDSFVPGRHLALQRFKPVQHGVDLRRCRLRVSRWIGLRAEDARYGRESGSTPGQLQKLTTRNFSSWSHSEVLGRLRFVDESVPSLGGDAFGDEYAAFC